MKKLLWLLLVCILSGPASAWATQAAPRTAATTRTAATVRIPVTCGVVLGENALPIFNEDGTYLCGEVAAPNRTAR
jgi:hypothetical protein